jgi:aspartate kinase
MYMKGKILINGPAVFKFGGASLKNPKAIQNVTAIIKAHQKQELLVVVSAMGKTTNELEQIVFAAQSGKSIKEAVDRLQNFHLAIVSELFPQGNSVTAELEILFSELFAEAVKVGGSDQIYDQVVSLGEIISSKIVTHYLKSIDVSTLWLDAREYIKTDNRYREGKINWEETRQKIKSLRKDLEQHVLVTQGFIGSDPQGLTTTLGREGSDFSAAIFASCLDASAVTIWKDVPGIMNADPKRLAKPIIFEELPFREAAEMTYYGASIIHPKTIKPLANAGIPLYVKSFDNPGLSGTTIHDCTVEHLPPLIIHKENQCLISCKVTDYSFITEQQIGVIFEALSERSIKINVMQSSAISFTFCVDFLESRILKLIEILGEDFEVYYNTGLTLITVKNYDQKLFQEYRNTPGVILEQSSRSTLQILIKT